jgi:hypothetical protein
LAKLFSSLQHLDFRGKGFCIKGRFVFEVKSILLLRCPSRARPEPHSFIDLTRKNVETFSPYSANWLMLDEREMKLLPFHRRLMISNASERLLGVFQTKQTCWQITIKWIFTWTTANNFKKLLGV